jgi:hypothetical protein
MLMDKLAEASMSIGSPYILWLALYLIARYSAVNMRRVVPWVRALRWFSWFTTGAMFLVHLLSTRFPAIYGFLSLGFSSGIIFVDTWATRRFAPERISAAEARYWPSEAKKF